LLLLNNRWCLVPIDCLKLSFLATLLLVQLLLLRKRGGMLTSLGLELFVGVRKLKLQLLLLFLLLLLLLLLLLMLLLLLTTVLLEQLV
jgi:hypothetical protein